jgi:hypothetical protein
MRLHYGSIPTSDDFHPEETGWMKLREPPPWLMMWLSLPLGVLAAVPVAWAWFALGGVQPGVSFQTRSPQQGIAAIAVALTAVLALIVIHELLHAAAMPDFGLSRRTIIGVWPSHGLFYAHHEGELTKDRFLVVFLTPLMVISVLVPATCILAGWKPPWLALLTILNALFACGDRFGALLIFFQVPRGAICRNQGWMTWWRHREHEAKRAV